MTQVVKGLFENFYENALHLSQQGISLFILQPLKMKDIIISIIIMLNFYLQILNTSHTNELVTFFTANST